MGGTMNLNPLKKDDNTDALVKALEDANNMGGDPAATAAPQPAADPTTVTDSATIAADPQITGDATMAAPVVSDAPAEGADLAAELPAPTDSPAEPTATDTPVEAPTDTSLSFDGNDLPAGLSADADAHLDMPSEGTGESSELDSVKKDALEQLRPLIEKLDLEPADKFDKYLMMLRASDDPALIKPAFEAAQAIGGEKEKAQALLDIINEINYISSSQQS